jgi:precorrin-8X/cobalt-precorrin-8 methylmutase
LSSNDKGVIVLGHGSRASGSGEILQWVVDRLAGRLDCPVRAAFLQFNQPDLEECCRELAAAGASELFIAPYFLFEGNHMIKDIPRKIEELEAAMPGVNITLAATLGKDDKMVSVLRQRLMAAGYTDVAPVDAVRAHPIEAESFDIIDGLLNPEDPEDPRYQVARRVAHATGDTSMADMLSFSPGAVRAGISALSGSGVIFCDVKMVAAGIEPTATRYGLEVVCGIDEKETQLLAAADGITRGAAAMRRRALETDDRFDGALVAVGNAPTALFELMRLAGEGLARPELIVGVPVGFVGAAESKEELAATGMEFITLPGNRGGSNVAAAAVNALIKIWAETR